MRNLCVASATTALWVLLPQNHAFIPAAASVRRNALGSLAMSWSGTNNYLDQLDPSGTPSSEWTPPNLDHATVEGAWNEAQQDAMRSYADNPEVPSPLPIHNQNSHVQVYPEMATHTQEVERISESMQSSTRQSAPLSSAPPVMDETDTQEYLGMLTTEVSYKKLLGQNPYSLTDIDVPTIVNRVLDTFEDGTQKRNGKLKGQAKLSSDLTLFP